MMRRGLLAILCTALAGPAAGETPPEWTVNGTNTLRYENYRARGNLAASPYPWVGSQSYNELNLNAGLRRSPYDQWRLQFGGVVSDSSYRTARDGIEMERFSAVREKGDTDLPYRIEFGDFLGFYSLGTLQQVMKGGQIDMQWQTGKRRQSLQMTLGAFGQSWRQFEPERDYGGGVSWVMDDPSLGRYSANFVASQRRADVSAALPARSHWIGSFAGERTLRHAFGTTLLEGEFAHFTGDHNTASDRSDSGITLQASGTSGALNYRLRHERVGQDFQPRAGVLSADRRSLEGYLGYRFAGGLDLRTRAQEYITAWESANPATSRTLGATLSGRVLPSALPLLTASIDAYVQDAFDRTPTTDGTAYSWSVNLAHPLPRRITARANFGELDQDNHRPGTFGVVTRQAGGALDVPLAIGAMSGNALLGLQLRDVRQTGAGSRDLTPTLGINLRGGPHGFNFNYSLLAQDFRSPASTDVGTTNLQASYRYQHGQHSFGAEYNRNARHPSAGQDTQAFKLAVFWSYSFERPAVRVAGAASAVGAPAGAPAVAGRPTLLDFRPGMAIAEARARLERARIHPGIAQGRLVVIETPLLDELALRQQLVLVEEGGRLDRSVLIIDFDDTGNARAMIDSFERVRRHFLDRLGRPRGFFERGTPGANLALDIRQGSFIRVTDWTVEGGFVRLGIPARIDGKVRIEVHFSGSPLPPENDTAWGLPEH